MTAAGTVRPAKALVIGAGVAGLQAIATAKRLGAVVKGVDVRPAVQEQVESLGARFVSMEVEQEKTETAGGYAKDLGEAVYKKQQEILEPHVKESNVVITTALVPGREAPKLISEEMVQAMAPGAVIVDLAATAGGNCALTEPGKRVVKHGVTIFGPLNLPSEVALDASQMFSRNIGAYLGELVKDGALAIDMENEVVRETLVTRDGGVVNESVKKALGEGKEQA
jgi:NAD(P) transhydrogenase subunit alpha